MGTWLAGGYSVCGWAFGRGGGDATVVTLVAGQSFCHQRSLGRRVVFVGLGQPLLVSSRTVAELGWSGRLATVDTVPGVVCRHEFYRFFDLHFIFRGAPRNECLGKTPDSWSGARPDILDCGEVGIVMNRLRYLPNVTSLKLDTDKCNGCKMCLEVCPHAVFVVDNRKSQIVDRDACMECGACMQNCESGALAVNAGVGCAAAIIYGAIKATEATCC